MYNIENIYDYISITFSNPKAAKNIVSGIISRINSLEIFPYSHRKLEGRLFSKKDIRIVAYKNFLILYSVIEKEKTVLIISVFYEKRNYEKLDI